MRSCSFSFIPLRACASSLSLHVCYRRPFATFSQGHSFPVLPKIMRSLRPFCSLSLFCLCIVEQVGGFYVDEIECSFKCSVMKFLLHILGPGGIQACLVSAPIY